jgi:hypothetical protein
VGLFLRGCGQRMAETRRGWHPGFSWSGWSAERLLRAAPCLASRSAGLQCWDGLAEGQQGGHYGGHNRFGDRDGKSHG